MFFFSQQEGIRKFYPVIFDRRRASKASHQQNTRIAEYNKVTQGAEWWIMAYEVADWDYTNIPTILRTRLGEILQFQTYKILKQELDSDLQEIIYKEAEARSKAKK